MKTKDNQELAKGHGLNLMDHMEFNEMGIDFKFGFATDLDEALWVLGIPRRTGLGDQIAMEKTYPSIGGRPSFRGGVCLENSVRYPGGLPPVDGKTGFDL